MISVSTLSSYMYCPRKLYLQYVLKLTEPPKEALVRGSIRHKTYELINENQERLVKSIKTTQPLEKLKEKFKDEYSKFLRIAITKNTYRLKSFNLKANIVFNQTWPLVINESETRAENIHSFITKFNVFGDELWEKLTPKIQSELRIESPDLGIRGIVDQVEIYEAGFVPVELKTGKTPKEGVWPGHKIQLAAYALLLEDKFKMPIKEGFVTYLDTKQRRHIPINPFLRIEIRELIDKVNALLKSDKLPKHETNENKCRVCGLKEQCFDEKKLASIIKRLC